MQRYQLSNEVIMMKQIILSLSGDGSSVGKVMGIQGIRDILDEYLGENRDIFRKELVHTGAIYEGCKAMWEKKQNAMADRYLENESFNNDEAAKAFIDVELYFIDLYEVRYGDEFYDEATYNQHIAKCRHVFDNDEYLMHTYTQEQMEDDEADYQEYLADL